MRSSSQDLPPISNTATVECPVSVVIPVYNAAAYVETAVRSALDQPETADVLLVEDGSSDDSLEVCRRLAETEPGVRLLRHPRGRNRGAGASRNLGVRKARYDTIAFLDADDYYLPGRFVVSIPLFARNPEIDGVYEAVGTRFESPAIEREWLELGRDRLTTLRRRVPPEELFEALLDPVGRDGHFVLDGLTIRRRLFERAGPFDPRLHLHQDSAFVVNAAATCRLVPGRLATAVAMRRLHGSNRILAHRSAAEKSRDLSRMWLSVWRALKLADCAARRQLVLQRLTRVIGRPSRWAERPVLGRVEVLARVTSLFLREPSLGAEPIYRSLWLSAAVPTRVRHAARRIRGRGTDSGADHPSTPRPPD